MITTRNTNTAMLPVYDYITAYGTEEDTRNGRVISLDHPLVIEYLKPEEMVNFCRVRNANPFFHFVEMLWMLEAKGDLELIQRYVARMAEYSDDGIGFNAHYGHRIRNYWRFDQLIDAIEILYAEPTSRQVVVQIWSPDDLRAYKVTKDRACNIALLFRILNGELCMTVFNRSNDAIWGGVSGANITNLGIFQLYVAAALRLPVGKQWVVSNNLHLYLDNPQTAALINKYTGEYPGTPLIVPDLYLHKNVEPQPLLSTGETVTMLDSDIPKLMQAERNNWDKVPKFRTKFIENTAKPLMLAHFHYRKKDMEKALETCMKIQASDWRFACAEWLTRKAK